MSQMTAMKMSRFLPKKTHSTRNNNAFTSVKNAKLSTHDHAQSIFRPQQFCSHLMEANKTEPIAVNFWQNKCRIRVQKEHCTAKTRWRLLQWKILHNIYPTSILLNKMDISNNKNYAFGCNQTDYLEKKNSLHVKRYQLFGICGGKRLS